MHAHECPKNTGDRRKIIYETELAILCSLQNQLNKTILTNNYMYMYIVYWYIICSDVGCDVHDCDLH